MSFNLIIPFTTVIAILLSFIFAVIIIISNIIYRKSLTRYLRDLKDNKIEYTSEFQPVSVIVYSSNDEDNIIQNLPLILEQDYPVFEVIVINDSSTDCSKDILLDLELKYNHLYQTFVPPNTCNLSRKKLSITIGIKAAKYDIILSTAANCRPQGKEWLKSMMRNFTEETDIVIGYSHYNYKSDKGAGKWFRSFDTVINAIQYLSYALRKKPFRGDGNNLAYRKEIFFRNKGFSKSLNLHFGDDDLFVNEVADSYNTAVELSPESQLVSYYDDIKASNNELKLRYGFTAKYLETSAPLFSSFLSILNYLFYAGVISAFATGYQNIYTIIICSVILFSLWTVQIISYRKSAYILQAPKLLFSIPVFYLVRPLSNIIYRIKGHIYKKYNFTWQRRK